MLAGFYGYIITIPYAAYKIFWLWTALPDSFDHQKILFLFCAGNELFYVALYLLKWDNPPAAIIDILLFRQSWTLLTWAQMLFVISAPFCFVKNVINLVQLWKASKILVGVDLAERQRAREEAEARRRARDWSGGDERITLSNDLWCFHFYHNLSVRSDFTII